MAKRKNIKHNCFDCGIEILIDSDQLRKENSKTGYHCRCTQCRKIHQKNWYKNMSPERKIEVQNKMVSKAKNRWANMSQDEYDNHCKKLSDADKKYWSNITPDDYKIRCEINQKIQDNLSNDKKKQRSEKVSKSKKEWWANLTDEKYIKMCLSNKSAADLLWLNRSENEKDHYIKLLHDGYKKWYNDMSLDEKDQWMYNISRGYGNMSLDEKDQWMYNRSQNVSCKETSTELEFINILNLNKIDYNYQYANNYREPNFHDLFPENNIIKNNYVSPYHTWDFKLNLRDKSILVDIDGSIHDPSKTDYCRKFKNININIKDFIQFNDSQRPYQTDGLDAYVIKCYDDKLRMNSEVTNIKTGENEKLEKFIKTLNSFNLSESEKREIFNLSKKILFNKSEY